MSKWTNATLTADGQNLQAQLLDGGGFEFTKVTAADSSGTDKLTLTMQPSVIDGKTITVPVLLSNSNLSAGFTMNQLKFYARKTGIPAGDEIVYAIAEDETGDEIPSESDSPGFTIDWSYTFQFGNATSVNVSIDPAGLVSMALLGTPGGIATLNNAGAVPIEQGGTGAVTASAALAALGGMRASATGDDIPTSASDSTSISSQLSNLAGEKYTRIVSPPQSWAEVWALAPHVVYSWVQQTPLAWQPEDTPSGALRVELTIHNVASGTPSASRSAMLAYIDGATTLTRYVGEEMGTGASNGRWAKLATATSPQEFDLPLAEGYTQNNGCKYSKDQFNVVRVTFNLSKSAGTIAGGEVVATLPAGFRPKRYWACVAIGNNILSDAATCHPVVVQVATNGEISASMMVETDQAELRAIVCAMEFLAAD